MGNSKEANIYLASPAVVAWSEVNGEITDPRDIKTNDKYPYSIEQSITVEVSKDEDRTWMGFGIIPMSTTSTPT